jgi:mRNA interferase MazF
MKINQFEIWLANLNPRNGRESGKIRPVLIVQTDLLNNIEHPSTVLCPITSIVQPKADILRVNIQKGIANTEQDCDIMIDQIRAIDNTRLLKKIGTLPENLARKVQENLKIILD